ncbi:MAG: bifunctional glutamate N-acetyltransferase/amino-acid acetyltransferase ArgJ [Candidatus Brocadiia bacterium]
MKRNSIRRIPGGVIAAKGFRCAGVRCGIKTRPGVPDLGLILTDRPAVAAAVFTTNRVQAAPVLFDRELLKHGPVRGVVVNAGNANACTGAKGLRDARRMSKMAAECAAPGRFLVASTGIIGVPLPLAKVESGIRDAAARLGRTPAHGDSIARAIMTTDRVPKAAAVAVRVGGKTVRIGGIAKGSGMLAPNMATMLCFITTDCAIRPALLRGALRETVGKTFNRITVDGDCSTNDTVAVLASAAAGNPPIEQTGPGFRAFRDGLLAVAEELSQALVRDGEGASRFVEVSVTGARSEAEAARVARSIATSALVKCAINGGDPNWGRIICAAGYSGAAVEPERMRLWINGRMLFRNGMPAVVPRAKLVACMKPKEIAIRLDLGRGRRRARVWTCDLSKEYVSINADYHT